ncbi:RNA helicase [Ranunculus cassubicifolius]
MKRSSIEDPIGPSAIKKPVFLTKAQREQLAIQRREEEAAEKNAELNKSSPTINSLALLKTPLQIDLPLDIIFAADQRRW